MYNKLRRANLPVVQNFIPIGLESLDHGLAGDGRLIVAYTTREPAAGETDVDFRLEPRPEIGP